MTNSHTHRIPSRIVTGTDLLLCSFPPQSIERCDSIVTELYHESDRLYLTTEASRWQDSAFWRYSDMPFTLMDERDGKVSLFVCLWSLCSTLKAGGPVLGIEVALLGTLVSYWLCREVLSASDRSVMTALWLDARRMHGLQYWEESECLCRECFGGQRRCQPMLIAFLRARQARPEMSLIGSESSFARVSEQEMIERVIACR